MDKTKTPGGMPPGALVADVAKQLSAKKRGLQRLVSEGLGAPFPSSGSAEIQSSDPITESQMIVTLDQIRVYERNPRVSAPNPQYLEIRESIRNSGLQQALSITRRPGEAHYILEAGGGTRYQALNDLWNETREEKFYRISVLFKPWQGESTVLAKHLIENNVRGEMTFWDNASGFMNLKAMLEDERGTKISMRQFEAVLREQGLICSKTDIARYIFATEKLVAFNEGLQFLTPRFVSDLQPQFNRYRRFVAEHSGVDEAVLYSLMLDPVMAEYGHRHFSGDAGTNRFDSEEFLDLCDVAVAEHCGVDVRWLQRIIDGIRNNPEASLADINGEIEAKAEPPHAELPEQTVLPDSPASQPVDDPNNEDNSDNGNPLPPERPRAGGEKQKRGTSSPSPDSTPENLSPGEADKKQLLSQILAIASRLAETTNISRAITHLDSMPLGFLMEPIPLDPSQDYVQHTAWWAMAALSGQMDSWLIDLLPDSLQWKNMANDETADEITNSILGGIPDYARMHDWVTECPIYIFENYINLLDSIRQLKHAAPNRFVGAEIGAEIAEEAP
jgi:hypothetical protein